MWTARGLEHDVVAEGRTIGGVLRAAIRFIEAQTAFDVRHGHVPLSMFPPAPQRYWNAYTAGTAVPLSQLGIVSPHEWDIHAAFATRLPCEEVQSRSGRNPVSSPMSGRNAQVRYTNSMPMRSAS
jgi:hypothetical protein